MSGDAEARRADYVAAVHALRDEIAPLHDAGWSEEAIARHLVARRNALKQDARAGDPEEIVALMAARNLRKYGDPVGPGADWFFAKYGNWAAVIQAAFRTADLSKGL
ncbi:hypothetical protein M9979_09950 [Sphingomonas sp. RP10(2022)]|uniref:Uncharacterized protein n=1 Tax=Sphingomonas liriopis TaxID=2949094 RepID=A0A9X2KR28_9SPHN|nr:hypothetical protein [Sphingomonas liriopis]MCP3735191.1 hypothetical protein [Sphingomonas liriopis]